MTKGERKRRRKGQSKGGKRLKVDRSVVVEPEDVPAGSRFKGYADYHVQELVIRTEARSDAV